MRGIPPRSGGAPGTRSCGGHITRLVEDVIATTLERLAEDGIGSVEDVRMASRTVVDFSPRMRSQVAQTRAFPLQTCLPQPAVFGTMERAERVVEQMFDRFVERPDLLPTVGREKAAELPPERLVRHVGDYLSEMTDSFALAEHRVCLTIRRICASAAACRAPGPPIPARAASPPRRDTRQLGSIHEHLRRLRAAHSERVEAVLQARGTPDADLSRIGVEPPRDASHGDLSTNAAMVLAKPLGAKPRELADAFAEALREDADVASVEVGGPGFINLRLRNAFWTDHLHGLLRRGLDYGRGEATGHKVNVEYVSANPTGPLHVGHCRGAVVGDAIANVMAFAGNAVSKEYYINDAGAQIDVLARSTFLRYREALGEAIGEIPAGLYPGDYLKTVALRWRSATAASSRARTRPSGCHRQGLCDFGDDDVDPRRPEGARHRAGRVLLGEDAARGRSEPHHPSGRRSAREGLRLPGHPAARPRASCPRLGGPRTDAAALHRRRRRRRPAAGQVGRHLHLLRRRRRLLRRQVRARLRRDGLCAGADHGGYVKRLEAVAKAVAGEAAHVDVVLCSW